MTGFIEAKTQANQGHEPIIADAYYNRACYRSLLWGQLTDAAQKQELQEKIKQDLWSCCRLKPILLPDVEDDADFAPVVHEAWFQDILREIRSAGLS